MSVRNRMILAIVGTVLVILVFFLFLIRPRQTELSDVQAQVATEENRTQELQADLDRLRQLQRNAPALQAELERIRDLVPREDDISGFLFQVTNAANASGVDFLQISPELPKTPPEGAALAEVRISLGGEGGYFAIQDFVRRLYSLDRAVRIDILDLSAADATSTTASPTISLSATARIFFEVPAGVVPGATGTTVPVTPPPVAPAPAPQPTPTAATSP